MPVLLSRCRIQHSNVIRDLIIEFVDYFLLLLLLILVEVAVWCVLLRRHLIVEHEVTFRRRLCPHELQRHPAILNPSLLSHAVIVFSLDVYSEVELLLLKLILKNLILTQLHSFKVGLIVIGCWDVWRRVEDGDWDQEFGCLLRVEVVLVRAGGWTT